jgi:hypothetical protein
VPERGGSLLRARRQRAGARAAQARVEGCFRAGAAATGAEVEIHWDPADYLDIHYNEPLATAFRSNAESLGRVFFPFEKLPASIQGSTDMGNVSYRVPSIHPMLAAAPLHCTIHNPEFAKWAASELGDAAAIDGAKALAMTALDYLFDATLQRSAREAFGSGSGVSVRSGGAPTCRCRRSTRARGSRRAPRLGAAIGADAWIWHNAVLRAECQRSASGAIRTCRIS